MFANPDIIHPEIGNDWYEICDLYHTAKGCADQLWDLDLDDEAEWLEALADDLKHEARCADSQCDVDDEDAPANITLIGLADGLRDYCEPAYRHQIANILNNISPLVTEYKVAA